MKTARSYLVETEPASEGLFKLLNQYGWQKMRAIVDLLNTKSSEELESKKAKTAAVDVAREVISGSILQIAYVGIKEYASPIGKSAGALHFESKMNELISESTNARVKRFTLPDAFCIGREIGELPMGLVVYAARNQYNHFYEDRLAVVSEVIFNYLNLLWPNPKNGLSFNLYDEKNFYCYSALSALGWIDTHEQLGYVAYK